MHENRNSREYRDHACPAAMQDRDRFPESADRRLMSQLGERNSLNHRVHVTDGHESNIALVILNYLRQRGESHARIFFRYRLLLSEVHLGPPVHWSAIETP